MDGYAEIPAFCGAFEDLEKLFSIYYEGQDVFIERAFQRLDGSLNYYLEFSNGETCHVNKKPDLN